MGGTYVAADMCGRCGLCIYGKADVVFSSTKS